MTEQHCPKCGRRLEEHRRHLRFRLHQPVLEVPEEDRADRTWGNDVMMQVQAVGCLVRILIPVRLTGGYTVTYGAWLAVSPEDLRRAWEVWWTPAYRDLCLTGILANRLPAWEDQTYVKPLTAAVRDPESAPYAADSSDDFMRRVLHAEWPHEVVLGAIARFEAR